MFLLEHLQRMKPQNHGHAGRLKPLVPGTCANVRGPSTKPCRMGVSEEDQTPETIMGHA